MCGILAYLGEGLNKESFKLGLESINHRGPDSTKTQFDQKFTFGFNRLSIQDLTPGSMQPMIDSNLNSIIYNGEIYNFKKLRLELESLDYKFHTSGDVEVLMKSIAEWGFERALNKIQGMFSIIYFSNKENKIYAARDFFGIKPLFFSVLSNNEIILASEIKAIAKYKNNVQMDFNSCMNPIFFTGMSPKGKTMFENIFSLNPGDLMIYDINDKKYKIKTIFSIDSLVDEDLYNDISKMNAKSISEMYQEELEQSIKMHLISDAKCGVLFSAGLDSSIIAGVISNSGIDVDLFKYENDNNSDRKYTNSFLEFSNQSLHQTQGDDSSLILELPKLIYHYETINKSEGSALASACKLSRENGYKALLTGDCADEIFAGYQSAQEYFTKSYFINKKGFNTFSKISNKIIPGFTELFSGDLNHLVQPYSSSFFETFFDITLHGGEKKIQVDQYRDSYSFIKSKKEVFSNAFLMDEIGNRLQRFLIRADRFGMMESIELRVPYLLNSIVKLSVNTPYHKKTSFSPNFNSKSMFSNKIILKSVAKSIGVPKNIINRAKVGTVVGEKNFQNEMKVFKNISLSNSSSLFKINERTLKACILGSNSKFEIRRQIWNFLALEFLIDQFVLGVPYVIQEERIRKILF